MAHLSSLANLDVELNSKHFGPWPVKVGQYMLNCAAIELISYQYLNTLEATRNDFNENLDKLLSGRIQRIRDLVRDSSTIPQVLKDEIDSLWSEVSDLSQWRNRIAHNPVLPIWKVSDPAKDPPDLMGIPDMKQLKRGNVTDSISMDGLNKLIDATADVGQRLNAAVKKL
jgi:hypothetical protein